MQTKRPDPHNTDALITGREFTNDRGPSNAPDVLAVPGNITDIRTADMLDNPAIPSPSLLSYDEWTTKLQHLGARYCADGIQRHAFAGWVCARIICDFEAVELGCNALRIRRTLQDTRRDDANHYYLLLQCTGQMLVEQNGQEAVLNSGEVALIDSSRQVTYAPDGHGKWLSLHLPRKSLASYLGFEPAGGQCRNGEALPARLLRELLVDAARDSQPLAVRPSQTQSGCT